MGDPPLSIGGAHEMEIEASLEDVTRVPASRFGIEGGSGGRGSLTVKI